jgi:hypothetical protein
MDEREAVEMEEVMRRGVEGADHVGDGNGEGEGEE